MATVTGLFRSSYELEKATLTLLSQEFARSQLQVVDLHLTEAAPQPGGLRGWLMRGVIFGDTLDRADGTSVLDGIMVGATLGGLAGVVAGAAAAVGPVVLGASGFLLGGLVGYIADRLIPENRRQEYAKALAKNSTLLHVVCHTGTEADVAERILRENQAHEIGRAP